MACREEGGELSLALQSLLTCTGCIAASEVGNDVGEALLPLPMAKEMKQVAVPGTIKPVAILNRARSCSSHKLGTLYRINHI